MKTQLKVLTMYNKIRNLFREGLSKSAVSRQTGFDRKTVRKYLTMTEVELERTLEQLKHRTHKLSPYEEFIRQRIKDLPEFCHESPGSGQISVKIVCNGGNGKNQSGNKGGDPCFIHQQDNNHGNGNYSGYGYKIRGQDHLF